MYSQTELSNAFEVSPTVIKRWAKLNAEFGAEIARVKKPFMRTTRKAKPKIVEGKISADQIDDVLLALHEPTAYDTHIARAAIRQMRKEIRRLSSEINRLKHAEHVRKTGATPANHQQGNGVNSSDKRIAAST